MKTLLLFSFILFAFVLCIILVAAYFAMKKSYKAIYALGKQAYDKGDFEKAKKLFEQSFTLNKNFSNAKFMLATTCFILREHNLAEEYFEEVASIKTSAIEALYNAGYAKQAQKKYREALSCYNRAMEIDINDPDVIFNAGVSSFELEDYMTAQGFFARVNSLVPNKSIINFYKNRCKDELHDFVDETINTEILHEYERISLLSDFCECEDFYFVYARAFAKAGKLKESIEYCKKAFVQNSSNPKLYTLMALLEIITKNYARAKEHLQTAISLSPKEPEPFQLLSYVFFNLNNPEDSQKARDTYKKLLRQKLLQ